MNRLLFVFLLLSCGSPEVHSEQAEHTERPAEPAQQVTDELDLPTPAEFARQHGQFESYWYQGKAELARYTLQQHRYGETHEGEAVLIFVTEPFLPDTQVKHEHGEHESISVLKLNAYRRFYTGIYPYTIMSSSFVPADEGLELKVSTTVTEWCGNAYAQLNRRDTGVQVTVHSYFQNEADQNNTIAGAPSEDGLWARMRRDPNAVESGDQELIPALHWLRLRHRPVQPERAQVHVSHGDEHVLDVQYEMGRQVRVRFAREFPYSVVGWEEREPDGGRTLAQRTHAVIDDYWSHHGRDHDAYRRALGLEH